MDCQFYPDNGSGFSVRASDLNESIGLGLRVLKEEGGLKLGKNALFPKRILSKGGVCQDYLGDSINSFIYIKEINSEYKFIEGTFEFIAIDTICDDTINVTDGYMKVTYRP